MRRNGVPAWTSNRTTFQRCPRRFGDGAKRRHAETNHGAADPRNRSTVGIMNQGTLGDCLRSFQNEFNANERVKKLVKGWDRSIVVEATDSEPVFTMIVHDLIITDLQPGA